MIVLVLPNHDRWASWLDAMREFDRAATHGFSTFGFEDQDLSDPAVFE